MVQWARCCYWKTQSIALNLTAFVGKQPNTAGLCMHSGGFVLLLVFRAMVLMEGL